MKTINTIPVTELSKGFEKLFKNLDATKNDKNINGIEKQITTDVIDYVEEIINEIFEIGDVIPINK